MISLHITVYESDDGDRFRVNAVDGKEPTKVVDVTDQYEMVATQTEDGRTGFTILKREKQPAGD